MFFVVAVAADGAVAIFVVATVNAAIPNNVILVGNSKTAIPTAMCTFKIVAVLAAPEDKAYLLGFGVICNVPHAINAVLHESCAGTIP